MSQRTSAKPTQALAITEWPAWKTIKLGTHKSVEALRQALVDDGFKIGWGDGILKGITVAPEPIEIELVLVTVAELGFPDGATRVEIYDKALSLGLVLCPPEVGPQLRLQYPPHQPLNERLLVAMEPITGPYGLLNVFSVEHGYDGQWLGGSDGGPVFFWHGDNRWVFGRK